VIRGPAALRGLRFSRRAGGRSCPVAAIVTGFAGTPALGARFRRQAFQAIHRTAGAIVFEVKRGTALGALFERGHRSASSFAAGSWTMPWRNASPVTRFLEQFFGWVSDIQVTSNIQSDYDQYSLRHGEY
jgi:hypothetical protein